MKLFEEQALVAVLSRQLDIDTVELEQVLVMEEALRRLDQGFCLQYVCIPFRFHPEERSLDVAMSDPGQQLCASIEDAASCTVRQFLAGPSAIMKAVRQNYRLIGKVLPTVAAQDQKFELHRLRAEVSQLTARLQRDEVVIRALMALLVERKVFSQTELDERISEH